MAIEAPPRPARQPPRPAAILRWAGTSQLLLLLLTAFIAASVGYLVEQWVLWLSNDDVNRPHLLAGGTGTLVAVCVLAVAWATVIWGVSHMEAMRRGVFIHAVAETRLARHLGEDALLRAWVAGQWPRATVMPFQPVPPGSPWPSQPHILAQQVIDQAATATVLAPAARAISVLPAGPPHLMVHAGAEVAAGLAGDARALRLLADNTDASRRAFLEYGLPATIPQAETGDVSGAGSLAALLLVLPARSSELATAALNREQPSSWSEDSKQRDRERPEWESYRSLFPAALSSSAPADKVSRDSIRLVCYQQTLPETAEAYEKVLGDIREVLRGLSGTVYIQGRGPSSLMFGAGILAQRAGLAVGSFPFYPKSEGKPPRYDWDVREMARSVRTECAPPDPEVGLPQHKAMARQPWWRALIAASLMAGLGLPLLAGSAAMLMEWRIAGSQSALVGHQRSQGTAAGLVLMLIAGALLIGRRALMRLIEAPTVVISPNRPSSLGLGTRHIPVPTDFVGGDCGSGENLPRLANWITDRFCDVVTALPKVDTVEVDLSGVPCGAMAINDFQFGLAKSLRGNRPPVFKHD